MALLKVVDGWGLLKKGVDEGVVTRDMKSQLKQLMEDGNVVYSSDFRILENYLSLNGVKYTLKGRDLCWAETKASEAGSAKDAKTADKIRNLRRFSKESVEGAHPDGTFVIIAQDDFVAYNWKSFLDRLAKNVGADKPAIKVAPFSNCSIIYL
ncbi:MAG: hypothetical protein PHW69_08095 [Elusimicrobiaceae bacterium]|nr:hypothetical protein [Elusimicrobiaceae bacterium]